MVTLCLSHLTSITVTAMVWMASQNPPELYRQRLDLLTSDFSEGIGVHVGVGKETTSQIIRQRKMAFAHQQIVIGFDLS